MGNGSRAGGGSGGIGAAAMTTAAGYPFRLVYTEIVSRGILEGMAFEKSFGVFNSPRVQRMIARMEVDPQISGVRLEASSAPPP